jgi:RHS repeat-associated protein
MTQFSEWTSTFIDPEGRKTETDQDAFGRVLQRRTYSGSNGAHALYTTTRYEYKREGRLWKIVDDTGQPQMEYGYDKLGRVTSIMDRDSGTSTMQYNADGTLDESNDAEGRRRTYNLYDELARPLLVTRQHLTDTAQTVYRYDEPSGGAGAAGHLTSIEDLSTGIREEFTYDVLGRQTLAKRRVDSLWFEVSQTLDALGRPRSLTYPDFSVLQYQYGSDGRVNSLPGFASNIRRNEDGALTHMDYANGVRVDHTYDPTMRWLNNVQAKGSSQGSPDIVNMTYGYSFGGHLNTITDTVGTSSQIFGMDHLYRLTSATGSYGSLGYDHDQLGNLTLKAGVNFYYNDPNRPHRATSTSSGLALSYDLTGNVRSVLNGQNEGWCYDYNVDGRMDHAHQTSMANCAATGAWISYVYGPDSNVSKRISFEDETQSETILIGDLYEETAATYKKYVYLDGQRIAEWRSDGTKYFYLGDHLGGLNVVTNGANPSVVQRIEYKPYGEISSIQSSSVSTTFMYAGARKDAVAGLYDFGARFYDPALGRFLSTDPILADPMDPSDLNPYGYALGNPLNLVDQGGLSARPALAGLLVGFAVTVGTGCAPCGAAAGGAVSGGYGAQEAGGNVLAGALIGAAAGAAGASAGSQAYAALGANSFGDIVIAGAVGGAVSGGASALLSGGDGRPVLIGAATGAAFSAALGLVGKNPATTAHDTGSPETPPHYIEVKPEGTLSSWFRWLAQQTSHPSTRITLSAVASTLYINEQLSPPLYSDMWPDNGGMGPPLRVEFELAEAPGPRRIASLYQKVSAAGRHLKFGISEDPATRYTAAELNGGRLRVLARGKRAEMLQLERRLHETLPLGPEEGQLFYIRMQTQKGYLPTP